MNQEPSPKQDRPAAGLAPSPSHSRWVRLAMLLGLIAFAALFAFTDASELWRTLSQADLRWLGAPVLFAVATYLAMAMSYHGIALAAGARMSFWEMFKITIVANTVNYLVATGGLSGFAVRMYFLTQRAVPSGTAVVISLVQTFLTNITLMIFVLGGFLYLFRAQQIEGSPLLVTTILLVVCIACALLAALLLLHADLRRRTLFWLGQTAHWVMYRLLPHRTPARVRVWRYQRNLNHGIEFLLSRKRQMIGPVFYILLDWVFTLLILYTAFRVVQYPIRLSVVIVGFAVGIVFSLVSLIPGGLGVMEGSMSALFASFGVPFETAVVAVLLFRVTYYVLPVVVSLFFFHGMLVQGRHASEDLGDRDLPY